MVEQTTVNRPVAGSSPANPASAAGGSPAPQRIIADFLSSVPTRCMNDTYTNAIAARSQLEIVYHGLRRIIDPHAYGIARTGNFLLRAWQISGGSRSGQATGWKLFDVKDISSVTILPSTFLGPQPAYRRGDRAMMRIFAQL